MAQDNDRFVWAISFLDLFTCALGGVFVLTLLSVRERADHEVNDPAGYLFLTARFDQSKEGPTGAVSVRLPEGFEPEDAPDPHKPGRVTWSEDRRLVVISARIPYGGDAEAPTGTINLPAEPTELHFGTEIGGAVWKRGDPIEPRVKGRRYAIDVTWTKASK